MKVIDPGFTVLTEISEDGMEELYAIAQAARTCYRSEMKGGTPEEIADRTKKFVAGIIRRGHESVLEHGSISVRIVCDRGVSHEIVRHRHCAFSQESTRYCNYGDGRFGGELTFIRPHFFHMGNDLGVKLWIQAMQTAENAYLGMLKAGYTPQEARSVLPNSLRTEIVVTANYREWRHLLRLRTAPDAHPQMREIMIPILKDFQKRIPVLFDDITVADEKTSVSV